MKGRRYTTTIDTAIDCHSAREVISAGLKRPRAGFLTDAGVRAEDSMTGLVIGNRFWGRPLASGSGPPRNPYSPNVRGTLRPSDGRGCRVRVSVKISTASFGMPLSAMTAVALLAAYVRQGWTGFLVGGLAFGAGFLFYVFVLRVHRDVLKREDAIVREWLKALQAALRDSSA